MCLASVGLPRRGLGQLCPVLVPFGQTEEGVGQLPLPELVARHPGVLEKARPERGEGTRIVLPGRAAVDVEPSGGPSEQAVVVQADLVLRGELPDVVFHDLFVPESVVHLVPVVGGRPLRLGRRQVPAQGGIWVATLSHRTPAGQRLLHQPGEFRVILRDLHEVVAKSGPPQLLVDAGGVQRTDGPRSGELDCPGPADAG